MSSVGRNWIVAHDFAYTYGGAERVSRDLCDAVGSLNPLLYLAGDSAVLNKMAVSHNPLLRFNPARAIHRGLTPAYAELIRARKPIEGNLIASSYAFSHHVPVTGNKVVYCHSPLRQVWSARAEYESSGPKLESTAIRFFGSKIRRQDRAAASAATAYIATSAAVADRISKYYGITVTEVIAPAFDDSLFVESSKTDREDSYLWVGRITEPYKRLKLVLEHFRANPSRRLIVAGDGRDRNLLEATAPPNVRFIGWSSATELAKLYRGAQALIFPSEDDFGITVVEAMACGLPVIALRAGGACDTVVDGETGVFFSTPDSDALGNAIARFESSQWAHREISMSAHRRFGKKRFIDQIGEVISEMQ